MNISNQQNPTKKNWSDVSSNVEFTDYNSSTQILRVKFKSGKTYDYYEVPEEIHDQLLNAESIGKFLNAKIIKMEYECIRVDE